MFQYSPLLVPVPMSDNLTSVVANAAVRFNQYLTLASSTLYLWTVVKVFYIIQRYLPLVDTVIVMIFQYFGKITDPRTCELLFKGSGWSFVIGMSLSEGILTRRVLAVWGNSTRLCIALSLFSFGCIISIFLILGDYYRSLTFHSIPTPGMYCFATGTSHMIYLCWTLLTAYDAATLVLIAIPGFRAYKSGVCKSTLFQVVYRDGVLYYLYLFAISAVNVFLILKLPGDYTSLLSSLERIIHSILTSHVVLHIREQTYQREVAVDYLSDGVDVNAEVVLIHS
ncbi:hypothetical protein BDN72DRAFT_381671 [Pluteus cervinus]|uniref:Uncharacterized protein n=1 Tax=Pluteus cervinus TaxID=181527 RepID=A0ACD3ACS1_9AGAR|nr:hypothetical protein BDN72DRAFT_381671 [Pluteus cervinus]